MKYNDFRIQSGCVTKEAYNIHLAIKPTVECSLDTDLIFQVN